MIILNRFIVQTPAGWLARALLLFAPTAFAACPPGETELLPNIRALPAHDIAMLDADNMKFSSTSWNAGPGKFELMARTPVTDPATGQSSQPMDQRIYCSGGSYYDRPAGSTEYHPSHNHAHFNEYANYILEPAIDNPQNTRQGEKTSFCIMDTSNINTQLSGASPSAVFGWCPTQESGFSQGISVGWGDTYGSHLPGQSLVIDDLPEGTYRLRHIFDPKNLIAETREDDNESCKLIEIIDSPNGRYVADGGLCNPPPLEDQPQISVVFPSSASQNSCVPVTITGTNIAPELLLVLSNGTGPLPKVENVTFDLAGEYIDATICFPKAKEEEKKPQLGSDPVWDVSLRNFSLPYVGSATLPDAFRVTP